jgi:hypothetical protein
MQKAIILVCFVLYVTLTSSDCNKKPAPDPAPASSNYQPTVAGSEWNYTTTGTASGTPVNTTYKLTATSRDTVTTSRTYRVFSNSAGPNEYYAKSGSDYYRISVFPGANQSIELLNLKDNLAVGGTWQETRSITVSIPGFGSVPVTIVTNFSIAEKGISYAVNGVTFNNVIKVNATIAVSAAGLGTIPVDPSTLIQYYYADKVGMINNKIVVKIPLASIDVNTETKIGAYTIK